VAGVSADARCGASIGGGIGSGNVTHENSCTG
jgi:hypothetical protein